MEYLIGRLDEEMAELERKKALIDDTLRELAAMKRDAQSGLSSL